MKIIRSADCGNSPKNQLLETVAIALATCDWEEIADVVKEEITWEKVGDQVVQGAEELRIMLEGAKPCNEITIEHVVSHGRAGAVNGIAVYGAKQNPFCHMFEFGNTKGTSVKSVKTYTIG